MEPYPIADHCVSFAHEIKLENIHELFDLYMGSDPIFRRKSVDGQSFNPELRSCAKRLRQHFSSFPMPQHGRESMLLGPAAIPIHDNGDMPGNFEKIDQSQLFGRV